MKEINNTSPNPSSQAGDGCTEGTDRARDLVIFSESVIREISVMESVFHLEICDVLF